MSQVPQLDPRFTKLVALMESTIHEPERASARTKAEGVLTPDVGGFDRALRIAAYHKVRSAAPNNLFAGFDEYQEIDHPGHMAQRMAERSEKRRKWQEHRTALVAHYGSLEAVLAPCPREKLILAAVKPWRVAQKRPHQRWTSELKGWPFIAMTEKMPADLRAAIEGAYLMPATFAEARAELAYWQQRESDMEHALSDDGTGLGDTGLDRIAYARMEIVRDLVEHKMPLRTLPEILARMKAYRFNETGTDKKVEDAIIRDLETMDTRANAGPEVMLVRRILAPLNGCENDEDDLRACVTDSCSCLRTAREVVAALAVREAA